MKSILFIAALSVIILVFAVAIRRRAENARPYDLVNEGICVPSEELRCDSTEADALMGGAGK
jgi:hypothetical protein